MKLKTTVLVTTLIALFFFDVHAQNQIGNDIDGESAEDRSGWLIDLNARGDIIAIGAPDNDGNGSNSGHVRVYEWDSTQWVQKGLDIDGEAVGDLFGRAVSLNAGGNILAVGATDNDGNGINSGHVRVYEWDSTQWVQKGLDIDGAAAGDLFGRSVSLSADGNILAVGASNNDGNGSNSGHVQVYEWDSTQWVQRGLDIDGEAAGDEFGIAISLSVDGSILAVGGVANDGSALNSGHVQVYEWDSTQWVQKGLDINGEAAGDLSGISVSLDDDGNTIAIGANPNDGNGVNSGHVRIYEWDSTKWIQKGIDIDGKFAGDEFGRSVRINSDGTILVAGAVFNDGNGNRSGHVQVFEWDSAQWIQKGVDINGESADDRFGGSVSINKPGNVIAGASRWNDGNGSNSGHARVYCFATRTIDEVTACDSITWIDGITYTSSTASPKDTLTSFFGCDSIVSLNLTILNSTDSNTMIMACDSFLWQQTGITYTTSGIFEDTLTNVLGCDSIVSLDLTIISNDTSVSQNKDTLIANQVGASYQWLDCDNGFVPIAGANGQQYIAPIDGNYACEITFNSCTDTSSCINVSITGVDDISHRLETKIYPNPVQDVLIIDLKRQVSREDLKVEIITIGGQQVYIKSLESEAILKIDVSNWLKGIYLIKLGSKKSNRIIKLVHN